jgi:predicted DNA-binding antitoxin AbrB/MazE fold protein
MPITIEATYEDGVLKPKEPLPLREHQKVTISIQPAESEIRRRAPLIPCEDAELIEQVALDPELEF